ncbi:alpha/beta fold hydrolase [Amycolatopsis cihanbeyliensis]|uniref:Alpha-beta hydrolase superfamily lysophospholipase n=1 Tax=Amycolatopsis cihanbeyliensis TaxID=1128664 RepID=A0A542DR54_AMYCI|nr:alpha/beta fold hydrolase [Amycolatopsis cihanbeyliensis]TQJ05567.1 alpha-beta hydrolase superfamily lysophospholipase [Amycolatopsis cihanbeyliensis]
MRRPGNQYTDRKPAWWRRALAVGLVTLGVGTALTPAQPPATASEAACTELDIELTVALLLPATMHGRLCVPAEPTNTVQLLIPGGTFNSTYWDPPAVPGVRSFRGAMNEAGYATLTVDRLGTGRSTVPLGVTLTAIQQAELMHRVVQRLRAGAFGPRFDKVIIGGHSLGAAISLIEAATFRDVDGVLLTGLAHRIDPVNVATAFATFYPAMLDPKFGGDIVDPLYLTTQPNTREESFHRPGRADPDAVALDEATKDVFSVTEAADGIGVAYVTPYSLLVDVPVLLALGGHDPLLCSPLAIDCTSAETVYRAEAPYFSPAARLRTYVLPGDYGHAFNYAPNADHFHAEVVDWAGATIGR